MDSESQSVLSLVTTTELQRFTAQKPALRTTPGAILCGNRLTPTACLVFLQKLRALMFLAMPL